MKHTLLSSLDRIENPSGTSPPDLIEASSAEVPK